MSLVGFGSAFGPPGSTVVKDEKPPDDVEGWLREQGYVLGSLVGIGLHSEVRLCTDRLGHQWVTRVYPKAKLTSSDADSRFRDVCLIHKKVKHPHIVKLRLALAMASTYFQVVEYMPGGTLMDKLIAERRFSEDTARRYFQELIAAVNNCHRLSIANRDLSLEHLFLSEDGHVKVGNFFSACAATEPLSGIEAVCGSPHYVAPEVVQAETQPYDGLAADIWSCGVILYTMMSGEFPFDDDLIGTLFARAKNGIFVPITGISIQGCDLLSKMLTVDPTRRIRVASIIRHPWFKIGLDPALLPREKRSQVSFAIPPEAEEAEAS